MSARCHFFDQQVSIYILTTNSTYDNIGFGSQSTASAAAASVPLVVGPFALECHCPKDNNEQS